MKYFRFFSIKIHKGFNNLQKGLNNNMVFYGLKEWEKKNLLQYKYIDIENGKRNMIIIKEKANKS